VNGDITTNGIEFAFSLLKRGLIESWPKVSAKHLPAYLDEMTFRFNNRDNPYPFRDTMLNCLRRRCRNIRNLRLLRLMQLEILFCLFLLFLI
jgi:hypothetical protein